MNPLSHRFNSLGIEWLVVLGGPWRSLSLKEMKSAGLYRRKFRVIKIRGNLMPNG